MESVKYEVFYLAKINLVSLEHEINVKPIFKKPPPASHKTKYAPVTETNELKLCSGNNHCCL